MHFFIGFPLTSFNVFSSFQFVLPGGAKKRLVDSISSKSKPLSVGPREEPSVNTAEIGVAVLRSGRGPDTMNRRCCRIVW